eukprot:scaffold45117_cov32-Cyclotella_meneghiniana.AAC.3
MFTTSHEHRHPSHRLLDMATLNPTHFSSTFMMARLFDLASSSIYHLFIYSSKIPMLQFIASASK